MKPLSDNDLREFLEFKYNQYNSPSFIGSDPVSIPHLFTRKEDIEIAGFLTATISWGTRKGILRSAQRLIELMGFSPYEFIMYAGKNDLNSFESFVHRTFNGPDCMFFLASLKNIYKKFGGPEEVFSQINTIGVKETLIRFRELFFQGKHPYHAEKHLPDPGRGASAKRMNMFLRWMVRRDQRGVDFGLWKSINSSALMCPLDVHTGAVARKLGLLLRKSNDWKAVEELTGNLRRFDPADPVKYDFALFGLGVFEKF